MTTEENELNSILSSKRLSFVEMVTDLIQEPSEQKSWCVLKEISGPRPQKEHLCMSWERYLVPSVDTGLGSICKRNRRDGRKEISQKWSEQRE